MIFLSSNPWTGQKNARHLPNVGSDEGCADCVMCYPLNVFTLGRGIISDFRLKSRVIEESGPSRMSVAQARIKKLFVFVCERSDHGLSLNDFRISVPEFRLNFSVTDRGDQFSFARSKRFLRA